MTTCEIIDLVAIETTPLQLSPFPYSIIAHVLSERFLSALQQDFPSIDDAGSFPLASVPYGASFAQLIDELNSDAFR